MSLDYHSRRKYKQGKFLYLLDDEEKTAWIAKGHIGRCRRYRIPDHVIIDGMRYIIESVDGGAYNSPRTLHHLVIPDTIKYVNEEVLSYFDNLHSVYIGKRVEYLNGWNFRFCPKLHIFLIDKENPFLKYDNGIIFSKDGKILLASRIDRPHVIIPDGVEEIEQVAFWYHDKLESVTFPKTLRKIGDNSFSNCPKLRKVVLPEGFENYVVQCFMENVNLNYVDLPSTFTDLGRGTFVDCPKLQTVILRSPKKLDFNYSFGAYFQEAPMVNPHLYVPANLVELYRQDSNWSVFKHILPLEGSPFE